MRLSDYEGDELVVYVDIVRRETPDALQSFIFVKDSLRVPGNEAVLESPDGHYHRYTDMAEKISTWSG